MSSQAYAVIVFVHVLAAIVLVGGSIFAPLVRASIRAASTVGELRQWLGFARRMARFNPLASLVVLATGLYLGSLGWWQAGWFGVALVAFFANVALALGVVKPIGMAIGQRLGGQPEGGVPEGADERRRSLRWDQATDAMLANDCALLLLMLMKPNLVTSLALLVAGHVGVALCRAAGRLMAKPRAAAAYSR